jgi:hypothetical protein
MKKEGKARQFVRGINSIVFFEIRLVGMYEVERGNKRNKEIRVYGYKRRGLYL